MTDLRGEVCVAGEGRAVTEVAIRVAKDREWVHDIVGGKGTQETPSLRSLACLAHYEQASEQPLTEAELFAAYGLDVAEVFFG